MSSAKRRKKKGPTAVRVTIERLEVARGHDGLMRGEPEPVVALCGVLVGGGAASCVFRHLERFQLEGRPPSNARPTTGEKLTHRADATEQPWLVLVAVALEEDSGGGVQEVFACLGRPSTLSLFTVDEAVPEPRHLHQAAPALAERGGAHEVHLLFDGAETSALVSGDDFVGAAVFASARTGRRHQVRLPFRGADGRNDWTLVVAVRC